MQLSATNVRDVGASLPFLVFFFFLCVAKSRRINKAKGGWQGWTDAQHHSCSPTRLCESGHKYSLSWPAGNGWFTKKIAETLHVWDHFPNHNLICCICSNRMFATVMKKMFDLCPQCTNFLKLGLKVNRQQNRQCTSSLACFASTEPAAVEVELVMSNTHHSAAKRPEPPHKCQR